MRDTLRQDLVVGPGGIIEIRAPNLPAGSVAEVIVRLKKPVQPNQDPGMPIQRRPRIWVGRLASSNKLLVRFVIPR